MKKIAILMTCHNRREKTLECLEALFNAFIPKNHSICTYLVDDGSTDGTDLLIKKQFPQVIIIYGDGNLFWNKGMRLAWKEALKIDDFDYFIWLNDDTIINNNGLRQLIDACQESLSKGNISSIITGACCKSENDRTFSYGGRTKEGIVIPNGNLQKCRNINGNIVIIPKIIFEKIGILSNDYTHGFGDFDYGIRAIENGFNCYTTKNYVAICPPNGIPDWSNPIIPLKKRLKLFYTPKGLNFKDYITFKKKHSGYIWIIFALKAYLKVLFPSQYLWAIQKINKNNFL